MTINPEKLKDTFNSLNVDCICLVMSFANYDDIYNFSRADSRIIHKMIINRMIGFAFCYNIYHSIEEIDTIVDTWFIPPYDHYEHMYTKTLPTCYVDPYANLNNAYTYFHIRQTNLNIVCNDKKHHTGTRHEKLINTFVNQNQISCSIQFMYEQHEILDCDDDGFFVPCGFIVDTFVIDCLKLFPDGFIPHNYVFDKCHVENPHLRIRYATFINTDHIVYIGDNFRFVSDDIYCPQFYISCLHIPTFKNLRKIGCGFCSDRVNNKVVIDTQPSLISIGAGFFYKSRVDQFIMNSQPSLRSQILASLKILQFCSIGNLPVLCKSKNRSDFLYINPRHFGIKNYGLVAIIPASLFCDSNPFNPSYYHILNTNIVVVNY